MGIPKSVKSRLPRMLRFVLETGQRFKINIAPNHFYSETPDLRELRRTTYWRQPMSMYGVSGCDLRAQLEYFRTCCEPFGDEIKSREIYDRACTDNGEVGYGPIEGTVLYCYVRKQRPARIVQVGCGVTTAIILRAVRDSIDYRPEIVCIEPFPTDNLKALAGSGKIRLVAEKAQKVRMEEFTRLVADDLLFIDSTHSLRVGAEVGRLITEVLPRLAPGCRVHFHDILFPYDYTPDVLGTDIFFGRETLLLYAFLVQNPKMHIEMSLSMLHHAHSRDMTGLIPWYRPRPMVDGIGTEAGDFPSAIYLRTTGK